MKTQNNDILLSGLFTVNAEGKKVRFTRGNAKEVNGVLSFHDRQYDCIGKGNTNNNWDLFTFEQAIAIAEKTGLTLLSKDEWDYLFEHNIAKNSKDEYTHIIDGTKCLIVKPDNWKGRIKDEYTASEWETAQLAGLVALPYAGYRDYGPSVGDVGYYGDYWSSSPGEDGVDGAWFAYFDFDGAYVFDNCRFDGCSVRLVSVQ